MTAVDIKRFRIRSKACRRPNERSIPRSRGYRATVVIGIFAVVFGLCAQIDRQPAHSQEAIQKGSEVEVFGAGDCLNIRDSFGKHGSILACVPDGSRAIVESGPIDTDGESWWKLAGMGWAAARYLRVTSPPQQRLADSPGPTPRLPGLIAYFNSDRNVWVARPDGTVARQLTDDADPLRSGSGSRNVYSGLLWSANGRYLVFGRSSPSQSPETRFVGERSIELYDAATGNSRELAPAQGRVFYSPFWLDGNRLAVVDARRGFSGCLSQTFADQMLVVIDVGTGVREEIGRPRTDKVFISAVGPPSPDSTTLGYSEFGYCEGVGPVCAVVLSTKASRCLDENGWSSRGWISNTELRIFDDPYSISPGITLRPDIVFNVATGATRPASDADAVVVSSTDRRLLVKPTTGDILDGTRPIFHIPAQQRSGLPRYNVESPDRRAFLFNVDGDTRIGLMDGTNRSWTLVHGDGLNSLDAAWEPQPIPALLLVHGCGGSLATWTDVGWMDSSLDLGEIDSGAARGRVARGASVKFPGSSVYAIDYGGSGGTLEELAGLIPEAIKKIRTDEGDLPVFVASHSMGGVLVEFYISGLATPGPYGGDLSGAFLVAPPTRGAWLENWVSAGPCPQAADLKVGSKELAKLRAAPPTAVPITISSGTAIFVPFVGDTDGVVAYRDIAAVGSSPTLLREKNGIHADSPMLPNFITALCETVPPSRDSTQRCVSELRLETVKTALLDAYVKELDR